MALVEHLEKLRHFRKISQYKSIKSAAQAIGISQAGLSKSLSNLEEAVGVQLITRSQDGLKLTKEGSLLLEATENINQEIERVEFSIKSLSRALAPGYFRIGMYDSIAVYFFESMSHYLRASYPNIEIELVVDRSFRLFKLVENSEIDLCFAVGEPDDITQSLQVWTIFEDQYSYFVNPKCADSLESRPFIIYPEAKVSVSENMDNYFGSKKHSARRFHRVSNFETIKALAELKVGIGVLPNLVAQPLLQAKKLIRVSPKNSSQFFGRHKILMSCKRSFESKHRYFVDDILRISHGWSAK